MGSQLLYHVTREQTNRARNTLTKKRVGDVLGHLVSCLARLSKMTQLFVQHSLELKQRTNKLNVY